MRTINSSRWGRCFLYVVFAGRSQQELQRIFFQRGDDWNPKQIQQLLLEGLDPNVASDKGVPILFSASNKNDNETVLLLLSKGAKVDAKEPRMGLTALYVAAMRGYAGVVKTLLDHGAKVNEVNIANCPAIWAAASKGMNEAVKVLLSYKANTQIRCGEGNVTPKQRALENGFKETAALLP